MRISDWSSDVCSSDFGLYGLAWRHQWRPCVLDILDQAVLVIGVLGAGRVLDAAFLDHAEQRRDFLGTAAEADAHDRSEEHTSELQSLMRISYAVFCLKKKKHIHCTTRKKQ